MGHAGTVIAGGGQTGQTSQTPVCRTAFQARRYYQKNSCLRPCLLRWELFLFLIHGVHGKTASSQPGYASVGAS